MSQNEWPSYPVPVRPLAGIARPSARAPAERTWKSANRTACCSSGSPSSSTSAFCPEFVEIAPLLREERVPAGSPRGHEGRGDLIAHRRQGALVRPAVGHELDEPKPLSRLEDVGRDDAGRVGLRSLETCSCGVPVMM